MDPENILEANDGPSAAAAGSLKDAAKNLKDVKSAAAASQGLPKGLPRFQDGDLDPETARINQDKALESLGLYRYRIPGDGNCLYRAVGWQLKFDQEKYHPLLRRVSVKWMREYAQELMASGLLDSVEEIEETDKLGSWPGQAAIVSLANIFGINIAIVQGGDKGDIDIQHIAPFEQETTSDQGSVILAYLYNGHYDAVVDTPDMENPDFERWMLNVQKAHSEGTLNAQSPVAQDPYYSYVLHNGYDTLKLRQQEGETLPAYVATSAPASSAAPPHSNDSVHETQSTLEEEPPRFETDHSLETIRSAVDRPTVELQEIFTPDEDYREELNSLHGVPKQDLSLQDTIHNLDNERESGITNKLAYREGDVILEEDLTNSSCTSPVPMTTDDVMTDLEIRDRLPSDMFVSSSASSLATESEMSIHLDDDMETASTNFDSDCESRFAQPGDHPPQESSILFDDVFDHGSDPPEPPEPTFTERAYTKSLDRRFLRNRSREGLTSPQIAGDLEEPKVRPSFRPRQKIQRSAKDATPYQRPQAPDIKSDGWGINTSELLQAAGVTHAKPGETMAQVSQKYGPVRMEDPGVMSPEDMQNKDSNSGTLRSERFLAKRKKEGRKFKTDGETGQSNAKQSVLSPPPDIPSSTNVLANLEGLREWRHKYGPGVNNTVVHDGESSEAIREGSYDSPDMYMRRSESREESVESVIHVPSLRQKDTSQENSSVNSSYNDSTGRPSMQDIAHTKEMTVAGGYANNTQPLSTVANNKRSVYSPSRTFVNDTGELSTMTRSLPYKSSAVGSDIDRRSNTSSPCSTDGGDGPRGFSRRKVGYQHPRLARSRSNDAILDSPDRNGFDPSDSTRGSDADAAEASYDTLKGSARAQALLKSRMRPGRSPGRTLGKDSVSDKISDSVHKTRGGQSDYSSLPYSAKRDRSYETERSQTNAETDNIKEDFISLPAQPDFNPDPPGPSVAPGTQPSQSHPNSSSSRPSMSSSYTSSSSHSSEGPGLTNEELVNARRFSLESSQRVEDVLIKDPSMVLPPNLAANLSRAQAPGSKDKSGFEGSRRFKQAEQEYIHTHPGRESESREVGGKVASHSTFAKAGNASQHLGQSSSMHERHVGYNQHDTSMNQVDSSMLNRELTADEKSVTSLYSTQSASADVMSGMSALSGISLNSSDEPPTKAPPRFVRQMSSPSMSRKVIQPQMQQEPAEQPKAFVQPEPVVQPKPVIQQEPIVQPKPVVQQQPIVQPKPMVKEEPVVQPKPFIQQELTAQPKPVVKEEPVVQPKPFVEPKPVVQPTPVVEPVVQPKAAAEAAAKAFMLQEQSLQSNSVAQEDRFVQQKESVVQSRQFEEQGPVLEPKANIPQAPVVPPKPTAQPKAMQQETVVESGPVLERPAVQPKPNAQHKPFQPFRIAEIPKKMMVQRDVAPQNGIVKEQTPEKDQLTQPQRVVEKELVSPPVLHAEDSCYGFPFKKEGSPKIQQEEQQGNELMKSKLYKQQQQKMQEIQQEEESEVVTTSVEPASVRRHEITSQVSTSDEVKGSAPRMRVLPLHFVGRKGQTFTRQLSQEEEQALMSRRAKREEYERQSSKENKDDATQRGRSSTRESSQDSFKSANDEPASRSPKRYRSVERILVGDANVVVNGTAAAAGPLSPGSSEQPGIQIRVANEQGVVRNEEIGAQEEVRKVEENVVHEVGQENLFEKVTSGATHGEVENTIKQQGAQGNVTEQSTPASTPLEEVVSPRIIQTDPYQYQSPPDTPSYASSVCSSTGLREVEEIHCHHPGHQHYGRNVKARSTLPASLLFPGRVMTNQTSPAASATSSPYATPPASGPTSPRLPSHGESAQYRRNIPVQVTNESRKGAFTRSHSHWDDRNNDFEQRVDSLFNQHVERERRDSVPISVQRVSRQPADGASIPNPNKEKAAGVYMSARSNSVPSSVQTEEEQQQDDRPPPGIVKDGLRDWVEGQRAHQGAWDTYSQQSDAPSTSQYSQSQRSEADSQYSQPCNESGSMYSEDSRAESATPTPAQNEAPRGAYNPNFRRYNSRPEPQMYHPGPTPQQRLHREFIEERSTTDPMTGGTQWHRSYATESSGFEDGPDTWSARVELPNRPDWPRTGRRERFLRLRDRPFFVDVDRGFEFPSLLRPMRHRLRDDIKSAFDDDWFFRH